MGMGELGGRRIEVWRKGVKRIFGGRSLRGGRGEATNKEGKGRVWEWENCGEGGLKLGRTWGGFKVEEREGRSLGEGGEGEYLGEVWGKK
ncbi:unnamed protein product [Meloidogyne enterolobii]|uniref:Uncharacterized protein n=1 Tax=Meloidogyne enterolobii TaxID=390850 RepID=A0ACB0YSM6_MELEN